MNYKADFKFTFFTILKMTDPKTLLDENNRLKKEIEILNSRLARVSVWMEREIKQQTHKIAKTKASKMTNEVRDEFLNENFEEMIAKQINSYFWDLLLLNAPKWTIEWITTWEINFFNMMKNPTIDGFSVISAYHKILDLFVESFITNNFRKFAKKKNCTILRVNDPLEKSLNLIINKKYIMSVWRLYALLKMIREWEKLYDFWRCFSEYLDKYRELKDILLDDLFFENFTKINKSEILSSKRHSWSITKKETLEARKILIWDFKDKNSMIYKLLESQSVSF